MCVCVWVGVCVWVCGVWVCGCVNKLCRLFFSIMKVEHLFQILIYEKEEQKTKTRKKTRKKKFKTSQKKKKETPKTPRPQERNGHPNRFFWTKPNTPLSFLATPLSTHFFFFFFFFSLPFSSYKPMTRINSGPKKDEESYLQTIGGVVLHLSTSILLSFGVLLPDSTLVEKHRFDKLEVVGTLTKIKIPPSSLPFFPFSSSQISFSDFPQGLGSERVDGWN